MIISPIVMLDISVYGGIKMLDMTWEECAKQYQPLCYKMVNKYKNVKLDSDERYNLALFGLWKAWKYYDDSKPASFLTYANFMICREFNLVYRNDNLKKRKHEHHLDINRVDDEGNTFLEILEDDSTRSAHHLTEIDRLLDHFKEIATSDGLAFIDKLNGIKVEQLIFKYGYAKRTMYKHLDKGKQEFIKYLEEKDVWL